MRSPAHCVRQFSASAIYEPDQKLFKRVCTVAMVWSTTAKLMLEDHMFTMFVKVAHVGWATCHGLLSHTKKGRLMFIESNNSTQ